MRAGTVERCGHFIHKTTREENLIDYSYAVGDKKRNLPGAGDRQGAHSLLVQTSEITFGLSSDALTKIFCRMAPDESRITANVFGLIEKLVEEVVQLRDQQAIQSMWLARRTPL